jgi:hypothetical protein
MHGAVISMPISDATEQVAHMHSIFWGSQDEGIMLPSMPQNRPILEVMAGSMQEVIEEEFIEEVLEQSMFMLQSFMVPQS